jgi:hypothetical protein
MNSGTVNFANELGHRELAKLTQIRRKQHGKKHVATGPSHKEDGSAVAHKGNEAGHRDKRCRRHPVGRRRHAVGNRIYMAAGDIEIFRSRGTGPDGNTNVNRKREADD